MAVVVVTDSSACLPAELRETCQIRQVPLHLLRDGVDLRVGVDQVPDEVYQDGQATTAAASPAELSAAYRRALADSDGDGVVAVHISGAMSGTVGAGSRAAVNIGSAVRVIDSRSAAMGTGFVALAAARAAADGGDLATVAGAADAAVQRTQGFVVVQRLENLRRSGRIGGARAWLGTALAIKPVLRIEDGRLVLAQRVRTASRAVAAMVDLVVGVVGERPAAVAVHHVLDPDGAAALAAMLAERLPACAPALVTELEPVLGMHVGAGALAVCLDVPTAVDP